MTDTYPANWDRVRSQALQLVDLIKQRKATHAEFELGIRAFISQFPEDQREGLWADALALRERKLG